MSLPQIFTHSQFGDVLILVIDGREQFAAVQVATALGYKDPYDAIRKHCREEGSAIYPVPTIGGTQQMKFIDEGNLYRLIVRSKLPTAEKFERWVFDEVLPSIRKTGSYNLSDPQQLIALALIEAQKIIENKDQQIALMQPKADFFDQVADSKDAIDIGTAAKVLKIPGIGRNKLFEFLRDEEILMTNNQPFQRYIDAGYFRVIEQKYSKPDGSTNISIKTLVYQKGLDYIRRSINKKLVKEAAL
jgi:prophage antirepressor-like protein